jgi:hypothetical protein
MLVTKKSITICRPSLRRILLGDDIKGGEGSFGGAYSTNGGDKYYTQILSAELL